MVIIVVLRMFLDRSSIVMHNSMNLIFRIDIKHNPAISFKDLTRLTYRNFIFHAYFLSYLIVQYDFN